MVLILISRPDLKVMVLNLHTLVGSCTNWCYFTSSWP